MCPSLRLRFVEETGPKEYGDLSSFAGDAVWSSSVTWTNVMNRPLILV